MNEVLKVLKERRSCRKFLPDAVPEELLAQVLEAGTYAASGMGRQSAIMLVVTDPELRKRLNIDAAAQRVANFLNVSMKELAMFSRITGHADVHDLNLSDLVTLKRDIADCTGIPYAGDPGRR